MTNIVLTATMQLILAAFNQFAENADLDISLPIREPDITQVKIREREYGWCFMVVGDRHRFNWTMIGDPSDMRGRISYDDRKYSTRHMDTEKFLPPLTNSPSLITTNEARQIAEKCLQRLGYDQLDQFHTPPIVHHYNYRKSLEDPPKPVPFFGIRWLPKDTNEFSVYVFEIEVSGLSKKVTRFSQLTFEGTTIDLRQFMTNAPSDARAPETNAAPESPLIPQSGPP